MSKTNKKEVRSVIKPVTRRVFSSLGMVIPFRPTMCDDHLLHSVLDYTIEMVKAKMEGRFPAECITKVIKRLNKLFAALNFNTHRHSLAIILTEDEEKVIYFSYPLKPVVFLGKRISVLNLAANIHHEASFYVLVLKKDGAMIHEYNSKKLTRVYKKTSFINEYDLFKNAVTTLYLLNGQNEKPVFITGYPGLVERFCCNPEYSIICFPLLYRDDPDMEKIKSLAKEIEAHWNHWRPMFIAANVVLAQKTNSIVCNIEAVTQALRKGFNGLLLIDKQLKRKLQKPLHDLSITQIAGELISHIEKFLANGNQIEITQAGLLKDMGGIILLQRNPAYDTSLLIKHQGEEYSGTDHVY